MLLPLSPNQRLIFNAFADYVIEHDYPPTFKEIADQVQKKAISTEVVAMTKKGWLTKLDGVHHRSVLPSEEAMLRYKETLN